MVQVLELLVRSAIGEDNGMALWTVPVSLWYSRKRWRETIQVIPKVNKRNNCIIIMKITRTV